MALAAGALPTLLLYEAWRDQFPRRIPTSWPFDDYRGFETWLRAFVRANRHLPVVWEAWNEWDSGLPWWGGTEAQLHETYALIDRVVRQEVGSSAEVAGPSFARFDSLRFLRFADYCVREGCEVNTWTWHELKPEDAGVTSEHLRWTRARLVENPAYASLRMRRIDVNEVIAQSERYSPAALVTVLRALHSGGADAFGRSCWREHRRLEYECLNASFDGIVDSTARSPRTAWWVHAAYARIREAPVATTSGEGLAILAGRGNGIDVPALVLLAPSRSSETERSVTIELRNVRKAGVNRTDARELRVVVRRLPWLALDAPADSLPVVTQHTLKVDDDTLRLQLALPPSGRITERAEDPLVGRDALLISIEHMRAEQRFLWPVAARSAHTVPR